MSRSVNDFLSLSSAKVSITIPNKMLNMMTIQINMNVISNTNFTKYASSFPYP